jgi:hypothetical protein
MTQVLLFVAALVVGQPGREAKEPTYKIVDVLKENDTVVAQKEKGRTVFVVTSPSGIGDATIVLAKGEWPENVTLRFQYEKGKGFYWLEDIRMYNDRVVVRGTEKMSGKMMFCFAGPDPAQDVIEPGGRDSAGLLDVRVRRTEEGMEVILPANMLRGSGKLRVSWIDAFRR